MRRPYALENLLAAVDEPVALFERVAVDFAAEHAPHVLCVKRVHVVDAAGGERRRHELEGYGRPGARALELVVELAGLREVVVLLQSRVAVATTVAAARRRWTITAAIATTITVTVSVTVASGTGGR